MLLRREAGLDGSFGFSPGGFGFSGGGLGLSIDATLGLGAGAGGCGDLSLVPSSF